ncbi:hypothetical protein JL721_11284 [Aureococcus anophagefferens]|nr:hypothetical protein JL721_11284 [Aureococcus anophagefferens]
MAAPSPPTSQRDAQRARVVSSWPVELLFRTPGLLTRAKVGCDYHVAQGPREARVTVAAADGDGVVTTGGERLRLGDLGGAPLPPAGRALVGPLPPFVKGQYAAGGAGEKALFAVEYAKPAPHLHTRLFAKVPWGANNNRSWRERISCGSDADGKELSVYQFLGHGVLPFDVPKLYFADLDRQSTDYVVVTERFSFPPSDLEVMLRVMLDPSNRKELTAPLPGTTLPHREKFRDRYDPCPWPLRLEHYYGALMRCQGQLAAAAERGDLGAAATQPDNAKFTMGDAKYEVLVAPFDWGGAGFGPLPLLLGGTFSGVPHETYDRHEDQFFIAYCDELCAGSGRRLDNNELRDLFRACDGAISALVAAYYVGTDVVQAHWNTRCWVTNLHERAWAHTERKPRTPGLDAARALAEREAVAVLGAWARVLF